MSVQSAFLSVKSFSISFLSPYKIRTHSVCQ